MLFDQALVHFRNSEGEEDQAENQKITRFPERGETDLSEAEIPCKVGQVGEREDEGELLGPGRKVFNGEKGPAEEKHGRDK